MAKTMDLCNSYLQRMQKKSADFTGKEINDLPNVEMFCSCANRVFSAELDDENNHIRGEMLHQNESVQLDLQTNVIDLLLIENHTCLLCDLSLLHKLQMHNV